ncbi:class I SAM-dependent methyltransferase [Erythrobacter litoralis]|uniref:Methyltransferase type 11 domain-containing protein n=1 Tax=Erythrobacter litoralis (strain HTCC2594) TaxID=314225 RepID=Q2ND57_ERYLH|nr:class I SAM-dependent methyltransferase [Erythrobacter litoralis]ABC62384.1 hypothetical protein ELI_01460 [Erythrobacter litoralis HTCC2594]
MAHDSEAAWGDFWARQSGQQRGGCLPEGWRGIDAVQQEAWHGFAADLPQGARVLDLATGDGRVMRWMLDTRPDLECTGVDLAPSLPPPPKGTTVKSGIPMEELPFDDGSFEAVVSQFGFEYGDMAKTAHEIARVLAPGGTVALMTHRLEGPILAHNKARRMQIGWALERKDVIGVAKRSLALRAGGVAAVPMEITQAVQEGAHRFGPQSAAWEISEAVRRTLLAPAHVPAAQLAATLDQIGVQAANEMGRIASLEAACRTAADEDAWATAFEAAGFVSASSAPLAEAQESAPFAEFRLLTLA